MPRFFALSPDLKSRSYWAGPEGLLILLSIAMALSFASWMALLNNFVIERAAFTGREIGFLQSIREIPGFLAFTAVLLLLVIQEQRLAVLSLLLLGVGTAATGYFPSEWGLYLTTLMMSIGFHYYETMQQSLTLQWVHKERAPLAMGRQLAAKSFASLAVYGVIFLLLKAFGLDYQWVYLASGGLTIAIVLLAMAFYPHFSGPHPQRKSLFLRQRYWLYYALTFMGGARRQIFIVFAGFLMVEKFGFDAAAITLLYLANHAVNIWLAPKIGQWIIRWGERRALIVEYCGLIAVFSAYALVDDPWVAAGLYLVDHLFFGFSIAMKSYFQKIADPGDMAATAGISFTINHIAAVFIPALFGLIWLSAPSLVFLLGAGMAGISLLLAFCVPHRPDQQHILHPLLGRRLGPKMGGIGGAVAPAAE